ncbi:GAF domain-containing sensor histidine kinase [Pseudomonas alcaligenes]|uniref:GAF domain-containing sensor histidine kinase n=1 Tax=Pseudomonas sp. RIT-PI-AD TaxID=3035294 RepID=UPI0021D98B12
MAYKQQECATRSVESDIASIGRIGAVSAILQIIVESTGLRFAAIARVTEDSWTACAVLDRIGFGLEVGGELEVTSTLCHEIRSNQRAVVIDKASEDPCYRDHHTRRRYRFESYISVPVFRVDGSFFGTICALDPLPAKLSELNIEAVMHSFARLLALQLDAEESQQRTETALLEERETAEVREQFIAVLGHDLRNPLFAITASAEMLLRKAALDAYSSTLVNHILTCGRRASKLVEDVLDFARGRLGNGIPLDLHDCADLEAALLHVVDEVQRVHPKRIIRSRIQGINGLRCDCERIAQLLSNLVANAIAHGTPTGIVDVEAVLRDGAFVLSVSNQGTPIAEDHLARLFQPYSRPSSPMPRAGLGLGLYIASEIARAHGASLDVRSTAKEGTTFTFTLPLA